MMKTVLREPLFHFVVVGVLLFAAFRAVSPEPVDAPNQIVVSVLDVEALEQQFKAMWKRLPSEQERETMIDAHIRQEVLVREAEALGLDRNDSVIRQRLQQKMDFLLSSSANIIEPSEDDLEAYLAENAERYEVQGKAAFEQIFLGQTVSDDVVATALSRLKSGADVETIGERTLLPTVVPLSPHTAINATFGRGFAGALVDLPTGQWAGPVQSGYGQHLVQVKEQSPARLPPLDDIRDQVEAGWREVRARDMSEAMFEELRARYEIDIEMPGT
jgi:PPIC-type PPIASE domain